MLDLHGRNFLEQNQITNLRSRNQKPFYLAHTRFVSCALKDGLNLFPNSQISGKNEATSVLFAGAQWELLKMMNGKWMSDEY